MIMMMASLRSSSSLSGGVGGHAWVVQQQGRQQVTLLLVVLVASLIFVPLVESQFYFALDDIDRHRTVPSFSSMLAQVNLGCQEEEVMLLACLMKQCHYRQCPQNTAGKNDQDMLETCYDLERMHCQMMNAFVECCPECLQETMSFRGCANKHTLDQECDLSCQNYDNNIGAIMMASRKGEALAPMAPSSAAAVMKHGILVLVMSLGFVGGGLFLSS